MKTGKRKHGISDETLHSILEILLNKDLPPAYRLKKAFVKFVPRDICLACAADYTEQELLHRECFDDEIESRYRALIELERRLADAIAANHWRSAEQIEDNELQNAYISVDMSMYYLGDESRRAYDAALCYARVSGDDQLKLPRAILIDRLLEA